MNQIILFAVVIFLISCNNATSKKEDKQLTKATITCYLYAFNNDTVNMQLKDSNQALTGTLNYLSYEKDSRTGTLYDMQFSGDTLMGIYKSYQEGMETICEIAMLKNGNSYTLTNDIWGSDNYKFDANYTHGKFIDKTKITFTGDTLKVVNCK